MKNYIQLKESLPDLTGKVFAITGTTSGTGFVAAKTVGEKGGKVLLLNRPSERSKASLITLKAAVPAGDFTAIDCDLQDFDSVRTAAHTIVETVDDLYCLANNAGIMALPNKATKDGYDVQMQTNHLSHFLLTKELFPLLEKGVEKHGEARVVNHSSAARNMVPGKFLQEEYLGKSGPNLGDDKANMASFTGGNFVRYHHSKLANTVFTAALSQKITNSSNKIKAVAAHPGVANTNLADHLSKPGLGTSVLNFVFKFVTNSVDDATMGLLYGMASPDAQNGILYGPKKDKFKGPAVPTELKPHETDATYTEMLWKKSEEATGVVFQV